MRAGAASIPLQQREFALDFLTAEWVAPMVSIAFVLFGLVSSLCAQVAGMPPGSAPPPPAAASHAFVPYAAKRASGKPPKPVAPGGGPGKVWVNLSSGGYHCMGDRYYGTTAHGRYMSEAAAKAAGAHGPRGKTCAAAAAAK